MKRFAIFILLLIVLIAAEYYFFSELFSDKRLFILLPSLLMMGLAISGIFRFVKKSNLQGRRSSTH
jgi:hypothetical protein